MDNIAGSPVEGENFFGREAVVKHLCEQLYNGDILLLGPRRIGKTSTARAVMVAVREQGWQTLEINVASCVSERDFLEKLGSTLSLELSSFPEKIKNTIIDPLASISKRIQSVNIGDFGVSLEKKGSEDWTSVGCEVLQLIAQAKDRWLIYMDELPIMLYNIIRNDPQTGIQRVRRFLDWFRNDVRALPKSHRVRWLISGSIGLDTLVQEHGMADTINSLSHEGLEPFSDETALKMLNKLANRYNITLSEQDGENILAAVQWSQPYYLQMIFNHLRELIAVGSTGDLSKLIPRAVDKMVRPGGDNDFHHWGDRLRQQLNTTDAGHALALLNLAAHDPNGIRPEVLLSKLQERMSNHTSDETKRTFVRLRDIFLRDAYWQVNETDSIRRYQFCLEPLRLWWVRRDTL